jgi:hypothetical protein
MDNVNAGTVHRRTDRWWRHPWYWMLFALGLTGLAFVWARCLPSSQAPVEGLQVPMIVLGILAAGIAIWLRCASTAAVAYLDELPAGGRRKALLALAATHGLIALAVSSLLVLRFTGTQLPGDLGGDLLMWLLTAPWCAWSAKHLYQRANDQGPLSPRLETAVLVTQGGLTAMLAAWALFWGPERADAWDSMRLFFFVLGTVAFLAAPIAAAEPWLRRLAVSGLVILHFAAIMTAVLGMQPGPYIFAQAQHWIFRPYLQFAYLTNAYRFYSPEPSPASQLWFRVEYQYGNNTLSRWVKLPEMDDTGAPRYLTSVQFTRRLALTENVAQGDERDQIQSPLMEIRDGQAMPSKLAIMRDLHAPVPESTLHGVLGVKQPANPLGIPYHPELPRMQNYNKPSSMGRKLLASYARHILSQPHPDHQSAVPVRVKIYRVLHNTLTAQALARGADPHDPIYYLPYYVGQFDRSGNLLDAGDPFLYWVLPILRQPDGSTMFYIYKHSGDLKELYRPAKAVGPTLK